MMSKFINLLKQDTMISRLVETSQSAQLIICVNYSEIMAGKKGCMIFIRPLNTFKPVNMLIM